MHFIFWFRIKKERKTRSVFSSLTKLFLFPLLMVLFVAHSSFMRLTLLSVFLLSSVSRGGYLCLLFGVKIQSHPLFKRRRCLLWICRLLTISDSSFFRSRCSCLFTRKVSVIINFSFFNCSCRIFLGSFKRRSRKESFLPTPPILLSRVLPSKQSSSRIPRSSLSHKA